MPHAGSRRGRKAGEEWLEPAGRRSGRMRRFRVERGDRPRLHEPEAVVGRGPLHVLWRAVVLLDRAPEAGELDDLVGTQDLTSGLLGRQLDALVAVGAASNGKRLVADTGLEQPRAVLGDDVGVGLDQTAHNHLTQPKGALDHVRERSPRCGVGGEHHAGTVGVDHSLHDDRDRGLVGDALRCAVREHTLAEERAPAVDDAFDERLVALDVGERLVHSRE